MTIVPLVALFSLFSLSATTLIEEARGADVTQTLAALNPLFVHLEKKLKIPVTVKVISQGDLDVSFSATPTNGLVTIKKEVLCDFMPEIIEVVIAARAARWKSCSPTQKNILNTCHQLQFYSFFAGSAYSIASAYEWITKKTPSFGDSEKCVLLFFALFGSSWTIKQLLEWQRKATEETLTKSFIATAAARKFLISLSSDSQALLTSQKNLRFLFEKFRKAA